MKRGALIPRIVCVLPLLIALAACSEEKQPDLENSDVGVASAATEAIPLQAFLTDPNAENPNRGQWRDLSKEPFHPEWVGGTLTFLRANSFKNFNLFLTQSKAIARVHRNFLTPPLLLESLEQREGAFYFRPEAAASLPEISDDGRKHRWTLKAGMTWEGGSPVTSTDFAFTHQMMRNKDIAFHSLAIFADIEKIVAVDALRFDVFYRSPQTLHTSQFGTSFPLLSAKETPKDPAVFNKTDRLPSCGPYRIAKASPEGLRLVLRDEYRQAAHPAFTTYVETIEYRYVGDGPARKALIREGRCDITTVDAQSFEETHADEGFRKNMWSSVYFLPSYDFIGWNCLNPKQLSEAHPVLGNAKVRKALAHFIDRAAIIARTRGGVAVPVDGPAFYKGRDYDPDVAPIPFDPEAGLALLKEAGYVPNSRGFLAKDGVPLKFNLMTPPGRNWFAPVELMVESFRQYGIQASLDAPAKDVFWQRFNARQFDAFILRNSLSPIEPDHYLLFHSSLAGKNTQNWVGIKDQALDTVVEEARAELDPAKRLDKRRRIHKAVVDAHPYTFLWATPSCVAVNRRWANVKVHERGLWLRDFVLRDLMKQK